jgi:hypothetical protein
VARPSVTCYPHPGKLKSLRILEAFAKGCGAVISNGSELLDGAAAFYGVVGLELLWAEVIKQHREYYYIDNSYFDRSRGTFFRVGTGALQHDGTGEPDYARLDALQLDIKPWRKSGNHIVVVAQSDHFMKTVAAWHPLQWQHHVLTELKKHTDRPIVLRHWNRNKMEAAAGLAKDLAGAHAVVVHSSAAANEALLAGVPIFATSPCSALRMGLSQLDRIEYPRMPDGRRAWAAALAAKQWTLEEFSSGKTWAAIGRP